jgi:hypothetical protein
MEIDYIYYVNKQINTMRYALKNYLSLLITAISFYIAYLTGSGIILDYVKFSDPLGEMAVFILATMMGAGALLTLKK